MIARRPLMVAAAACAARLPSARAAAAVRRVGVLSPYQAVTSRASPWFGVFQAELQRAGYDMGRNLVADSVYAEGEVARQPALAAELVRRLVEAGGLLYYGADVHETIARIASFVDRILRGARPADLPIEQPTRFEFVAKQRAARALGITLPADLLLRATRVIE